jgi:hypothetical protein
LFSRITAQILKFLASSFEKRSFKKWPLFHTSIRVRVCLFYTSTVNEIPLQKWPTLSNQKGVILLHDNGRPHVAKLTQQKIEQLGWEVLAHAPYSPNFAPSDYHLFLSLHNYLCSKHYQDFDEIKSDLTATMAIILLINVAYLCWKINLLLKQKQTCRAYVPIGYIKLRHCDILSCWGWHEYSNILKDL